MANMPVSIPLDLKVKGLKALAAHQGAVAADVARLLDGQMILAEAVGSLLAEVRELVTNVERLNTALDNIQTDITGLKDAAVAAQNDFATRLDALQAALDASTAGTDAAVAAAVQELTDSNNAALADLVAKADAIDLQTPAAEVPETPEEPAPPVEEPPVDPEPTPEDPAPEPDPEQPVEPV